MKKAPAFDAAAWASTAVRRKGPPCTTCRDAKLSGAIHEALAVMAKHPNPPSLAMLRDELARHFDSVPAVTAIRDHVRKHESKLWGAIRGEA